MNRAVRLYESTIGKKILMAVTGAVLFGFVVGHVIGNLQVWINDSGEHLNAYAAFLKHTPSLLWGTRLVLLASVAVHIVSAVQLALRNVAARPVGYQAKRYREASWTSRTMMLTGPLLAVFIVVHLLHFTTGTIHPAFSQDDVYANVVIGFSSLPMVAFYVVAMLALGAHLIHGVWSMFQSAGVNHPRYNAALRTFATAITGFVIVGFISIPVAVVLGIVH